MNNSRRDSLFGNAQSVIRNPKLGLLISALLFVLCSSAEAQQPPKIPRIGYQSGSSSGENNEEPFRQGLRELGYVEGQNIVIEWRFAEGKAGQIRRNAAELVQLKVDVIVTGGAADTRAVKEATRTIPIIMTNESDAVGTGIVASLSRPGGNVTGLASLSSDLVHGEVQKILIWEECVLLR